MKARHAYVFTGAVAVVVLAAGIFLPALLSDIQHSQYIGRTHTEPLEEVGTAYPQQLTTIDRLNMLGGMDGTQALPFDSGTDKLDATVGAACRRELETLRQLGLIPSEAAPAYAQLDYERSYFYISTADPSRTLLVRFALLSLDDAQVLCYLDDQAGKLLKFAWLQENMQQEDSLPGLAERWGSYLDVPLRTVVNDPYTFYDQAYLADAAALGKEKAVAESILAATEGLNALYGTQEDMAGVRIYRTPHGVSFGYTGELYGP